MKLPKVHTAVVAIADADDAESIATAAVSAAMSLFAKLTAEQRGTVRIDRVSITRPERVTPPASATTGKSSARSGALTPTRPPVVDHPNAVDDLRVLACAPPTNAVQVCVVSEHGYVQVAAPPATYDFREHLMVLRDDAVVFLHSQTQNPPWHLMTDDDVLLASVRMPAGRTIVDQAQIVDRRSFDLGSGAGRG